MISQICVVGPYSYPGWLFTSAIYQLHPFPPKLNKDSLHFLQPILNRLNRKIKSMDLQEWKGVKDLILCLPSTHLLSIFVFSLSWSLPYIQLFVIILHPIAGTNTIFSVSFNVGFLGTS